MLGLGYCTPYLDVLADEGRNVMAMMPARQGVVHWPARGNSASALVDEACLPLADGSMDFVLVVHGLELTDQLPDMLRELWRVLAPQGRAIFIVPTGAVFGHGLTIRRSVMAGLFHAAS